jgi:DNA adenine methylase
MECLEYKTIASKKMELFSKGHYPESEVRTNAFATYSLRVGGIGMRRDKRPEIHWPELKEEIAKIVARLRQVWIENLPWSRCIAVYDRPDSFFYLDPPYRAKASKSYRHSFTDDDHLALAETLTRVVRGRWMLSYNDDAFIRKLYRRRGVTLGHLDVKYGLQGGSGTPKRELLIRNF